MARSTMHDVARLAGVSQRTVSNVVSGAVPVSPGTRERVERAITALSYTPHVTAQRLRGGRTGVLALALPEITVPYFSEIADLIQQRAQSAGSTLLIDQTGGKRDRELLVLDGYRSGLIDGLILNPIALDATDIRRHDIDVPIVLLGEQINSNDIQHVSIDNVAAARTATEHLLNLGRRRVAVIGAPPIGLRTGPGIRRFRGYQEAMKARGLPLDPSLIIETEAWNRRTGYLAADRLAASDPAIDAVFCFNDLIAVGLLKRFHELGVRVPDDIAVVGWDDTEDALYTTPTLTSIAPDKNAIADAAITGVLQAAGGQMGPSTDVGYELVVRGSADR